LEGGFNMSLTKKKMNEFIKDETEGNETYLKAAKKSRLKRIKDRFRRMAKDERKHRRWLKEMKEDME
jgi:rubrerythrin